MSDMATDNIVRKGGTGGDRTQFGTHNRDGADFTLVPPARQPGNYIEREAARVNESTGLTDEEFVTIGDNYLAAALWTGTDDNEEPLDASYSVADIDGDARTRADADIHAFITSNKDIVAQALATTGYQATDGTSQLGQLGHDFWLTRNRHGAGFWDRTSLSAELGGALTAAAHAMGETDLYVGDDGKLYF